MKFSYETKARLANYKKTNFPDFPDGFWRMNKKSYHHILPEDKRDHNLLPTYRKALVEYLEKKHIKLHMDFHHLNSSQAMCFNFFFPLYIERKLELITEFLGLANETVNYDTVCFEKKGIEAQFNRRPTCFDFFFETMSGKKLHFEIKYTEEEFGKAKINSQKFDEVYSKFLRPLKPSFHDTRKFFSNYQILRNLIHIDDNSYVIFIYPEGNDKVRSGAERVKTEFLESNYHGHFFAATWDKLFVSVSNSTTNQSIQQQLSGFKEKYLL
ncbi:MAG: hypothetical protein M9949_13750 [Candidatus Kapabacteria bacterium]|nr:hypothetical protein [Candidatus Kapabacteria bacterium]